MADERTDTVRSFCAELDALVRAAGHTRASLINPLNYSRTQINAILSGTVTRPPDFGRFVQPLVRLCTKDDPAALAHWRRRHTDVERAYEAARRAGVPSATRVIHLPADLPFFSGRSDELADMDRHLASCARLGLPAVMVLTGTAGVGKTSLAVHWAHRHAGEFPDGTLYADFSDSDPAATTPSPALLRRLLLKLGLTPEALPSEPAGQFERLREELESRGFLLVCDNVYNARLIRPLLPTAAGSAAVVVSRKDLAGLTVLNGASPILVSPLGAEEGRELLRIRLRITLEPGDKWVLDRLVERCGGLPLALALVAARYAPRPGLNLVAATAGLRGAVRMLDALADEDETVDLRSVFLLSYRMLSDHGAEMFRLLGHADLPDISVDAAASLCAVPAPVADNRIAELVRSNILMPASSVLPRYRMYGLLQEYARERAIIDTTPEQLDAAEMRVLDHYVASGYAASRLVEPYADAFGTPKVRAGVVVARPADRPAATMWFSAEDAALLRLVHRASHRPEHAWRLAWIMQDHLGNEARWAELRECLEVGLTAAVELGDQSAQARMTGALGRVMGHLSQIEEALRLLKSAIQLYEQLGDAAGEAPMHMHLSWVSQLNDDLVEARVQALRARELYRGIAHRRGQATALNELGWTSALLDDFEAGRRYCEEAIELLEDTDDLSALAATCDSLGYIYRNLGLHPAALTRYQQAVELFRALGDKTDVALSLRGLADTRLAAGDRAGANETRRQALAVFREIGHPTADEVEAELVQ